MIESGRKLETLENPEPAAGMDRRIAPRYSCDGFAEIVVPGRGSLFRGKIADLSETGCYVATRAHLDLKRSTLVELRFTVNGGHFSLEARAAILKSGVGAGFEFTVIEPSTYKSLLQLIAGLGKNEPVG